MATPHSDAVFVKGYPAETTEAFCDGHVSAFAFFGGIPQSILYDNTKIAVARILGDRTRVRTRRFTELQSHYLFDDTFGRPARGNDKGNVPSRQIAAQSPAGQWKAWLDTPAATSWCLRRATAALMIRCLAAYACMREKVNAHFEQRCLERQGDTLRGHSKTIGERLMSDLDALMGLPPSRDIAAQYPVGQWLLNMKPATTSAYGPH